MSLRRPMAAAVIAVLVLVAAAIVMTLGWQARAQDQQLDANRSQVEQQAGTLVAQLFSSAQSDPAGQARAAVTDGFARQYGTVLAADLPAGVSIVWEPVHTGISQVSQDDADAVVSSRVTETVPGAEPTIVTKVVEVHLERSGDRWKIARADEVL